jgi:phage-related protein (TIGR01555 family)
MAAKLPTVKDKSETIRSDGWSNVYTGLGQQGRDRKEYTEFASDFRLPETLCRNLYTYYGLARSIVEMPVYDQFRQHFTVEGDKDNQIEQEFKRIANSLATGAWKEFYRARHYARVYGGSLIVLHAKDGHYNDEPLDENNIQSIEKIEAFHRWQTSRLSYYLDKNDTRYGNTEMFLISPRKPFTVSFPIHESRCIIFDGVDVPMEVRTNNQLWGDSVYQSIYQRLRGVGEGMLNIEHIIGEFILLIAKIKGLASKLADKEGAQKIVERITMNNLMRHLMGSYAVDADGEDATRLSAPVTGLRELMEVLMMGLSADVRIPIRRLFGTPIVAAGLGKDGDQETKDYFNYAEADRDDNAAPQIDRFIKLLMLQKQGPFRGVEIPNWKTIWPPLYSEPMSVQLTNRKTMADIDNINWSMGVYDEDEIRENGYVNSQSFDRTMKPRAKMVKPAEGTEDDTEK